MCVCQGQSLDLGFKIVLKDLGIGSNLRWGADSNFRIRVQGPSALKYRYRVYIQNGASETNIDVGLRALLC